LERVEALERVRQDLELDREGAGEVACRAEELEAAQHDDDDSRHERGNSGQEREQDERHGGAMMHAATRGGAVR
jgi:hypothetical protein